MNDLWKAYTPEELARLAPGETVVTMHEVDIRESGKVRREKVLNERTFLSYSPSRGIVQVEFSFKAGRGETDFCDRNVGYYTIPAHHQLYEEFSSEDS